MTTKTILQQLESNLIDKTEKGINDLVIRFVHEALEGKNYERVSGGDNPYDSSGILEETGKLNKDIGHETVGELLDEYTGERQATYTSGSGWSYLNFKRGFGSGLEDEVENLVYEKLGCEIEDLLNSNNEFLKNLIFANGFTEDDYSEMLADPKNVLFDFDLIGIDELFTIHSECVYVEDYYDIKLSDFLEMNLVKETDK